LTNQAKAARKPMLRSETRDKPINTYPDLHSRMRAYYMAKDAEATASVRDATIQAKAEKVKAEKAETDEAKATNKYQAKAMNNGKSQDTAVFALVTKEQKNEALKIWKELLISTNHYQPFIQRTQVEELKAVKVLRSAMKHYRTLKLSGMEKLRTTHPEFQYLQEKYHIPREFCMPADFFREEQLDFNVAYNKRCCSVCDFYNMLRMDSPGYVDRETRRANRETRTEPSEIIKNPPWSKETIKSIRQESPVTQDSAKRRVNPSFNPFIHASAQPQGQDVVTFKSTNPSNLD
jgi:hypothetical protein